MVVGAGGEQGRHRSTMRPEVPAPRPRQPNAQQGRGLAERLSTLFRKRAPGGTRTAPGGLPLDSSRLPDETDQVDLIVNTTSVGLRRTDPSPSPRAASNLIISSTIPFTTRLKPASSARPLRRVPERANGLSLLLYQGLLSFELWFPGQHPLDTVRQSLREALDH